MKVLEAHGMNKQALMNESRKLSKDGSQTLFHSNINQMMKGRSVKEVTMRKICKVLQMKPQELLLFH